MPQRGPGLPRPYKALIYRHSICFNRIVADIYSFPTLMGAIEIARGAILHKYHPKDRAEVWIGYFSGPAKHSPYNGGPRSVDYYDPAWVSEPQLYVVFKRKK
jgi:hypothetical protein